MLNLSRGVRVIVIVAGVLTMQGCFTPPHVEGIELATALRREFVGLNDPPPMWRFHLRPGRIQWSAAPGEWGGVVEREGVLYDEYRFASLLVSTDGRRCLRILVPAGDRTADRPALLEEYEGEVRGESTAWLHSYSSAARVGHGFIEAHGELSRDSSGQVIPPDGRIIQLDVDARSVSLARGLKDESPAVFAVEDHTEWRERSGLEAWARVVTIPVAMVGDAGLIVGVVVGLPVYGIVHGLGEVVRGIGGLFSKGDE